jgi:hypothetical protein
MNRPVCLARCGESVNRSGRLCLTCDVKWSSSWEASALAALRHDVQLYWSARQGSSTALPELFNEVMGKLDNLSVGLMTGPGAQPMAGVGQSPTVATPKPYEAPHHTGAPSLFADPTALAPQCWAEAPVPVGPPRPYEGQIPALPEAQTTCRGDGELCRSWTCAKCNAGSGLEVGRQTRQTGS